MPRRDVIGVKVEMALLIQVLEVGAAYVVGLQLRVLPAEGGAGGRGLVDQPRDRRGGCRFAGGLEGVRAYADDARRGTINDKQSQKLLE